MTPPLEEALRNPRKEWGTMSAEAIRSKKKLSATKSKARIVSESGEIWINRELQSHEATANLDNQLPATLYYLGRVVEMPQVKQIFVEELEHGRRKHWTVLSDRNYEIMDEIYDIEEDTLDRFPASNLSFRVTVLLDEGPSVSKQATKIYDAVE